MATLGDASDVIHYSLCCQDVARHFPIQTLSQGFGELDRQADAWTEMFIQYFSVRAFQVKGIIAVAPQTPLFASAGVRRHRVEADSR